MKQSKHEFSLPRAFFVAGTDTGVGKTQVAAALCLAAGANWAYFKPAGSGDSDAAQVARLTRAPQRVFEGYHFSAPLAPWFAAEAEQKTIDPAHLDAIFTSLHAHAPVVVEGAGGLLAPYGAEFSAADLAVRWKLPVLLVAANRLGCLNHMLLSIEAAERRGLEVGGCVLNDIGAVGAAEARNPLDFVRLSKVRLVAWLPRLSAGEAPSADWWASGTRRAAEL